MDKRKEGNEGRKERGKQRSFLRSSRAVIPYGTKQLRGYKLIRVNYTHKELWGSQQLSGQALWEMAVLVLLLTVTEVRAVV